MEDACHKEQLVHLTPTPLASLPKAQKDIVDVEATILEGSILRLTHAPKNPNSPLAFLFCGQSPCVYLSFLRSTMANIMV